MNLNIYKPDVIHNFAVIVNEKTGKQTRRD